MTGPHGHELTDDQRRLIERAVARRSDRLTIVGPPGTGKTFALVEAVARVLHETPHARVLILLPGGLVSQIEAMLTERLNDPAQLRRLNGRSLLALRERGDGDSWPAGVFVASLQFARDPGVGRVLQNVTWDLVAVDEAHTLRGSKADLITRLAGEERPYPIVLLGAIKPTDERLSNLFPTVRWRRAEGQGVDRRRAVISYERSEDERRLFAHLEAFVDAESNDGVFGELLMRAWRSSVIALERTLVSARSRTDLVQARPRADTQMALFEPLILSEGSATDRGRNHRGVFANPKSAARQLDELLRRVSDLETDSKLEAAIAAVGERRTEGISVVTGMRETARYVADALRARGQSVSSATGDVEPLNTRGSPTDEIVVGTDAGLQGIELEATAILSYELPRSKLQLEQRWGRVDRIGRDRPVTMLVLRDLSGTDYGEDELLAMHGFTDPVR